MTVEVIFDGITGRSKPTESSEKSEKSRSEVPTPTKR